MRKVIFVHLLQYLYTDRLTKLPTGELVELLELANRLCLPRAQMLAEEMIISQLTTITATGQEIFEDVAGLLETAQVVFSLSLSVRVCVCPLALYECVLVWTVE